MTDEKHTFENDLRRLEKIAELLESEDVTLEESIKLFEEGINLSKNCFEKLNKAELKITELKKKISNFKIEENEEE